METIQPTDYFLWGEESGVRGFNIFCYSGLYYSVETRELSDKNTIVVSIMNLDWRTLLDCEANEDTCALELFCHKLGSWVSCKLASQGWICSEKLVIRYGGGKQLLAVDKQQEKTIKALPFHLGK